MKLQSPTKVNAVWILMIQTAFTLTGYAQTQPKEPYREIEPMRVLPLMANPTPTPRPYNLNSWGENHWPNVVAPQNIEPPLATPESTTPNVAEDPNPNTPEIKAYTQLFKEIKIAIRGRRMLLKTEHIPGPFKSVTVFEDEPIYEQRCDIEARCRTGEPHLIEVGVKNCQIIKPYKMGSCEYAPKNMRAFVTGNRRVERVQLVPTQITKKRVVQEGLTTLSPRQRTCAIRQRDQIQNALKDDASADTLRTFLKYKKIDIFLTDERWVALRNKKKAFIEEHKSGKLIFQIALVNPPKESGFKDPYCIVSDEFEIQLYLMDLIREQHFENEYHSEEFESNDGRFSLPKNVLSPFSSDLEDATLIEKN